MMIRVLQINAGSENFGGVSSILLNIYRNIDRSKIQFDFLTPNITTYGMYREEIENLSGHIYDFHINIETWAGKRKYAAALEDFLKSHSYDFVHINSGSLLFNYLTAITVKRSGGPKIIVHAHNNFHRNWWKRLLGVPLKRIMEKSAHSLLACSGPAAQNMFSKRSIHSGSVRLINDGIPVERYAYDERTRNLVRHELNIDNSFVIGHAGRFVEQKNHEFLIDVFHELCNRNSNAILLLIGQGILEEETKEKVHRLGLDEHVMFLGQRNDLEHLYQAMDAFCFPSVYEGLGMTLIEAQTAGLPCFISTVIPHEVDITDLIHRISLQSGKDIWAEKILSSTQKIRKDHSQEIAAAGYSIQNTTRILTQLYEK